MKTIIAAFLLLTVACRAGDRFSVKQIEHRPMTKREIARAIGENRDVSITKHSRKNYYPPRQNALPKNRNASKDIKPIRKDT